LKRKLSIHVAGLKPFPDGIQVVAYWHTDDPKRSLMDPYFYEHCANGDLHCNIWIAPIGGSYVWDFAMREVDSTLKSFLLNVSDTRWAEFQTFLTNCYAAIEKRPNEPFQKIFR
jgi:hypothetical protein